MKKVEKIVNWIRKEFTRKIIMKIVLYLLLHIEDDDLSLKDKKEQFNKDHPHYRQFPVDPTPPIKYKPETQHKNYKTIIKESKQKHNKIIKPVKPTKKENIVPKQIKCPCCGAPSSYIYYNNGKKRSQFKCKVCGKPFSKNKTARKTEYICPHCHKALYLWKSKPFLRKFKCGNKKCPYYLKKIKKLTPKEKKLRKKKPSQFKVHYSHTEYNFQPGELNLPEFDPPPVDLTKVHSTMNIVGLALTFYISYALSSRKTALILKQVFSINISHQTVLNYVNAAAYYCHTFNLKFKKEADSIIAGDETYIKVFGKQFYTWLSVGSNSKAIFAYHLSDNRGTRAAITTIKESIRTAKSEQNIIFVSDGNPSYPAAVKYIKMQLDEKPDLELKNVIGLENKDEESKKYRPYKQMIERLNRTYKYHLKPGTGYATFKTAYAHLALFTTHYNFLRPHASLGYQTPVNIPQLNKVANIQGRWAKIISMAA